MRSINIDIKRFINICVNSGAITAEEVAEATQYVTVKGETTQLPVKQHCGHGKTELGDFFSMFIATHRDTGKVLRSEDGVRVRFNFRSSTAAKKQNVVQSTTTQTVATEAAPVSTDDALKNTMRAMLAELLVEHTSNPKTEVAAQPPAEEPVDEVEVSADDMASLDDDTIPL